MVMPRLMQSVSRMFQTRGSAARSTGWAPVAASMIVWLANQAMTNQISEAMTATGISEGSIAKASAMPVPTSGSLYAERTSAKPNEISSNRTGKPARSTSDFSRLFQM